MKKLITPEQLVTWLDSAANDYDNGREHNPARQVLDRIALRLAQHLHGVEFEPGYLFEHVDNVIDQLRARGDE